MTKCLKKDAIFLELRLCQELVCNVLIKKPNVFLQEWKKNIFLYKYPIKFGIFKFNCCYYQMPNHEMPNLIVIYIKILFIVKMAYPIQFNNKYKIWYFVILHLIVSAVKLKNAKNDAGLCPGVARCSLQLQTFAHPFSFLLLVIAGN